MVAVLLCDVSAERMLPLARFVPKSSVSRPVLPGDFTTLAVHALHDSNVVFAINGEIQFILVHSLQRLVF